MSKALAIPLAVLAGCLAGMQAPVNSRLSRSVGSLQAATFSFAVGTVALVLIASLFGAGGLATVRHAGRGPAWAWIGGLFGAVYGAVALATVRILGASALTGAVIAGQLAVSVAIDRFGLFGLPRQPVGALRLLGLVRLVAGAALVLRR